MPGHWRNPTCSNIIGFASAALSAPFAASLLRAEQAQSLPHPGPWPIQRGYNLQPRADQLKAMRKQDLTTQEPLEVDRLYRQLEQSSQEMLERRHVSR
jgi:hypothetical protein